MVVEVHRQAGDVGRNVGAAVAWAKFAAIEEAGAATFEADVGDVEVAMALSQPPARGPTV